MQGDGSQTATEATWTASERGLLRSLRLDPIKSSPSRLRTVIEHFKSGSSVFAITEDERVGVSKDLARKVRNLTYEGKLDWVLQRGEPQPEEQESESTSQVGGQTGAAVADKTSQHTIFDDNFHHRTLVTLAATLLEQLSIPEVDSRILGDGATLEVYYRGRGDEPGSAWYLGWESHEPTLEVETHPEYPYLEQHLGSDRLTEHLGRVKNHLRSHNGLKKELYFHIRKTAEERTGLPISPRNDIRGGSLTEAFVELVYREAIRSAMTADPSGIRRYTIDTDRSVPTGGSPFDLGGNHPAYCNRQLIGWEPLGSDRFRSLLAGPSYRIGSAHSAMIDEYRNDRMVKQLFDTYSALTQLVRSLGSTLAPSRVRRTVARATCVVCSD